MRVVTRGNIHILGFCAKIHIIMIPNEMQGLEELRRRAFVLKQGFSKTEGRRWTASTVASELVLQVTHLQYALMSPNERENVYPTSGVDKGLEDELSDVLFNVLNVMSYLNLTLFDISETIETVGHKQISPELLTPNLIIQAANIWDNIARLEGYKHLNQARDGLLKEVKLGIAGVLHTVTLITISHKIDMARAMADMFRDAENFLARYKK